MDHQSYVSPLKITELLSETATVIVWTMFDSGSATDYKFIAVIL